MKAKPNKVTVTATPIKSKGKRHHLHAESLEHMARELLSNPDYPAYITKFDVAKLFKGECQRIKNILR